LSFTGFNGVHHNNPTDILNKDMCVHLISDDKYIDIKFTSWTAGGGGGFAYTRIEKGPGNGVGDACDCYDNICTTGRDVLGNAICSQIESSCPAQPFSCDYVQDIPIKECDALVALYDSTDGNNWNNNTNRLNTYNVCG
jgi:hypothetical protein